MDDVERIKEDFIKARVLAGACTREGGREDDGKKEKKKDEQ